ncbi:cytochrome oxidase maturation protein, cbb3-type [Hymenobacter gelipurpurascens]|uniref:Cytochrome oxidase maturation protein, cbb3-type n=1 Tax=Hymenobacter gelipurpurascens TaxID=89968 RepID=A0A212T2A5_9BACT|nr:cbb3-type cytochrome oxidase assembly protein CcoS [Hymenobacter gelipurpurascens]SNC59980.1 cytochrome oxidase maturation protein, cbb3-type [Hymenobacter gelipurpurascens]
MTIIFLLIGISLTVALAFLGAFLWAVRSGQYDDTYTPSVRVLFEEDAAGPVPPK